MKAKAIAYWVTTALIALETFAGGLIDLTHGRTNVVSGPSVVDVVTSLDPWMWSNTSHPDQIRSAPIRS